ncbi:hypothetical protein G7085_15395 [Tessaracoccus sp. HDW20]|uniref:hypothetical protein n=1 Tax=Tessaracoccus coleopterorum TaxID=2714950 RepID=UPI0018D4199D|nr:hypothetical protein [Tessaracoccus coleopterorum]NHB85526.1 hypothetical protein [Tessaracoccus coleopterorum]
MLRNVGRWIAYPLIAVAVTLVTGLIALPRGPGGTPERDYSMAVTSFDATYALEPQDGGALDVLVTEAIVVDFSSAGRHGIVRAIPLRFGSHPVGVSEVRVEARLHAQGDAAPDDAWRGPMCSRPAIVTRSSCGSGRPRSSSPRAPRSSGSATGSRTSP